MTLAGQERIGEHDVLVVDYRQTVAMFGTDMRLPREFGNAQSIQRGRLWIDADTHQLWRDVWELTWPHPEVPEPLVMMHRDSRYEESGFGILVPSRIVWEWRQRFSNPRNGPPSFALHERITFTYGKFRRFGVSTDEQMQLPR